MHVIHASPIFVLTFFAWQRSNVPPYTSQTYFARRHFLCAKVVTQISNQVKFSCVEFFLQRQILTCTPEYVFFFSRIRTESQILFLQGKMQVRENPHSGIIYAILISFEIFQAQKLLQEYLELSQGLNISRVFICICNFTVFRSNLFSRVLSYLRDQHFQGHLFLQFEQFRICSKYLVLNN